MLRMPTSVRSVLFLSTICVSLCVGCDLLGFFFFGFFLMLCIIFLTERLVKNAGIRQQKQVRFMQYRKQW